MADPYATHLQAHLTTPLREAWDIAALPLTDFEWLNTALLVRHRQRGGRPRPLFVALPAYTDDLNLGLRAATAAAWLAGHEAPVGYGGGLPLKSGEHVFYDQGVWLVQKPQDAVGKVEIKRYSDQRMPEGRTRTVAAAECRKLLAPFEFADLLNPQKRGLAGSIYLRYIPWLEKLLASTRQARQVFRLADERELPRPHGGHTLLLVPGELRYPAFEEAVLSKLAGAPTLWKNRTASGSDCWNLPFAASLHVVSSLDEAIEVRRKRPGITAWHLSVVGKRAVGNSLRVAQLVQAYDQGQWASLTFWGPDLGVGETPGCDVWPWSRTEARSPQAPPDPVRLVVAPLPAPAAAPAGLAALVATVRGILLGLSQPVAPESAPVRLPMVWNLLHRCLRYALPPGSASRSSRRYLDELSQQIAECLASDEVDDAFFEARRRWPEREAAGQQLQAAFTSITTYLQHHSPKHECLRQLVAEAQENGRPVWIVADRESLSAMQASWQGEPGVTVLPLLGTTDNLRRRLLSGDLPADVVIAVPFLFNRDQLALLQTAPGTVCLVLLAEVEEGLYARTLASQRQQELAQLRAGGRAALLGETYEQLAAGGALPAAQATPGTADSQLDYFAELYAVGDTRYASERLRSRSGGQLYAFTFADGYCTELDGHTRVLCRAAVPDSTSQPGWVPTQADQLLPGQRVLLYENDQRQLIEHILRQHDRNGLIQRIDKAARVWQQALGQLTSCYKNTTTLYHDLRQQGGLEVGQQTLQAYLEGRRRFPGDPTTLPALQHLAERHALLGCALLAPGALEEVKYCRSKFQQLAVALGKGLSEEVLRFRLTGASGKLLASLAPDVRELVLLSAVERTVRDVRRK